MNSLFTIQFCLNPNLPSLSLSLASFLVLISCETFECFYLFMWARLLAFHHVLWQCLKLSRYESSGHRLSEWVLWGEKGGRRERERERGAMVFCLSLLLFVVWQHHHHHPFWFRILLRELRMSHMIIIIIIIINQFSGSPPLSPGQWMAHPHWVPPPKCPLYSNSNHSYYSFIHTFPHIILWNL
jgi:hypothetical protein